MTSVAAGQTPVRLGPVRSVAPGRVEFTVDGQAVWFASDDADLRPAPEAAVATFVLAAGLLGRPLEVAQPVDARFAVGLALLDRTVQRWWGCRLPHPPVDRSAASLAGVLHRPSRDRRTALCFTCGVDSFHVLTTGRAAVDDLLFVHGYDVALADEVRGADTERRVRAVAAARGLGAIVVRTNLRTVEPFASVNWGQTHGGALAAVAHLLSDRIGTLVIGASHTPGTDRPWGSHWRTDRRWGSRQLRIDHRGHDRIRAEKVGDIATDPLAAEHLQVCWQLEDGTGNCRRCPKCILTMAMLDHHGALERFTGLVPDGDLADLIAGLPPSTSFTASLLLVAEGTSPVADAARARLAANPSPAPPSSRRRALADRLGLP